MILYDPTLPVSLEEFGIQIPIHDSRTTRTFEALQNHPRIGQQLHHLHHKQIIEQLDRSDLLRVHAKDYVGRLYSDRLVETITKTYELLNEDGSFNRYDPAQENQPLSDLFNRILTKAAGTLQCTRLALAHGFCFYFSGGMHHAHFDHGSGFCLINDLIIAARKLQAENKIKRVWIIDVDAHKGDGTAAITATDDTIVTLSIHMARGWPLDGPQTFPDGTINPAYAPSDIDIPMEAGEEQDYLERLEQGLHQLEATGPADLAIVVSGADPYEGDELPSTAGLKQTLEQLLSRDVMVYDFLKRQGVPSAFLMAGGYGEDVWRVYTQFLTTVLPREGYGHH